MVRAGLGSEWQCTFANDLDERKCAAYTLNWGDAELVQGDIANLNVADIGRGADLAWASFPCQDLSLAGPYGGLDGARSSTFWEFWRLMKGAVKAGTAPKSIVLENVVGIISSKAGKDFRKIITEISALGYIVGALVIDARHFVPQSRKRVFIVAFKEGLQIPETIIAGEPNPKWHPSMLVSSVKKLRTATAKRWRWWSFGPRSKKVASLGEVIDHGLKDVEWHSNEETKRLLGMMTTDHRRRVKIHLREDSATIGAVFKRMRPNGTGANVQRAEVSFEGVAGCLRTPAGGSSLQTLLVRKRGVICSRLISPRETARLMGLPNSYKLPNNPVDAYRVTGDGVVVPVVRQISKELLEPVLIANAKSKKAKRRKH
jgi:DNA-methyltransferase (dcm)